MRSTEDYFLRLLTRPMMYLWIILFLGYVFSITIISISSSDTSNGLVGIVRNPDMQPVHTLVLILLATLVIFSAARQRELAKDREYQLYVERVKNDDSFQRIREEVGRDIARLVRRRHPYKTAEISLDETKAVEETKEPKKD